MIPFPAEPRQSSADLTDCMLVEHILAGDERAFETLVKRYSGSIFTFVCRFLNDSDAASDALQHVFIQLSLSLPTLCTGKPLRPWLFRVARNRCLDELRRKRGIPFSEFQITSEEEELSPLELIPESGPLPEEIAEQHHVQAMLQAAIATLPPTFRAVVLLRYSQHMSFREIASTLEMPEATAKTYFHRAKPLLRTALHNQWPLVAVG